MKKFFALLSFAVIMFVTSTVANAAPQIDVDLTGTEFRADEGIIVLYTRLTNTGDQDAQVHMLNIQHLELYRKRAAKAPSFSYGDEAGRAVGRKRRSAVKSNVAVKLRYGAY